MAYLDWENDGRASAFPPAPEPGGESSWIDFSGIENPLGTPPEMVEALRKFADGGKISVSDSNMENARSSLAKRFGMDELCFLCGTTIKSMIRAVARAFDPATVGFMVPAPREYAIAMREAGCVPTGISSATGFCAPDPKYARASGGVQFNAFVLANPGYPGSRLLTRTTLERYLATLDWVVVDERSIELTLGGESMIPLVLARENLVVVRSYTEAFALPGIPVGFLVAHPRTIKQIEQAGEGVATSLSAALCAEVNRHLDHLETTRDVLETEIPWLQCMLSLVPGISIFPAEANYVLCRLLPAPPLRCPVGAVSELSARLLERGLAIRALEGQAGLPDDTFFCVSVRSRAENERLIAALRDIMSGD